MIRRTTWILLVLFVATLGLAWYLQRSGEAVIAAATPSPASQPVFDFTEGEVNSLWIENSQGQTVALQLDDNGSWALIEPTAESTDTEKVESAVRQLVSLTSMTTLDQPPPADVLGLSPPAYTITLGLKDGKQWQVQVGKLTPIETGYYAQIGDGAIQVLSSFGLETVLQMLESPPLAPTPPAPTQAAEETGTPDATPETEANTTPQP